MQQWPRTSALHRPQSLRLSSGAKQQLEQVDFSYVPNKYLDAGFMATHQRGVCGGKKKMHIKQEGIHNGDQLQSVIEQVRAKQEKH